MKIYDSHVHLHINKKDQVKEYQYYDFNNLQKDQIKYGITKSICFLNPFVPSMLCPKNHKHIIKVLDRDEKTIKIYCKNCDSIIYEGIDPLRKLNISLLEKALNNNSIIPFIYLNISSSINEEIKFFEKKYGNMVKGYKIHPKLCSRKISEININSDKPLIIHTGIQENTSPQDIIKFSKHYKGKIILAHCARFSKNDLLKIKKSDNLYIDISPFMILFRSMIYKPETLYDMKYLGKIDNPNKLLKKVIEFIGVNKIVFGSDTPFSNLNEEIDFIKNCDILNEEREQILYKNLESLLYGREQNEKNSIKRTIKSK